MDAVTRGLAFIAAAQDTNGSFKSFSSPSKRPFVKKTTYTTTFVQAIMLGALTQVHTKQAMTVRQRLADWLLSQRGPLGSFNYWPRGDSMSMRLPYPDDFDDTFCALIGLYAHNPSLIDPAWLAQATKLLIAAEAEAGGPYRTWLVPPTSAPVWKDIDVAVNANVAGFLGLVAGPLPNLVDFIEKAIRTENLASPYYPSSYPTAYYMARAYQGPQRQRLTKLLLKQRTVGGNWGTPLQTALAISTLVQLGWADECTSAITYLQTTQGPDGSWPAEAFCLDPAQNGRPFYNGAPALTTALAVEALARYEQATKASVAATKKPSPKISPAMQGLNDQVYDSIKAELAGLAEPLAAKSLALATRLQKNEQHHEITLLPKMFTESLTLRPAWATDERLAELGKANLYGWMAYTIFDDFLDEEGDPTQLPAATTALRCCLAQFRTCLPGYDNFQRLVEEVFNTIDAANAWEVTAGRCKVRKGHIIVGRLPHYGRRMRLAERSLGHMLTPLAILVTAGYRLDQLEVRAIRRAFTHYIIARQLSDDLHDWEHDLQKGHISYVVCELLRAARVQPGPHQLSELLPRLQRQCWHRSVQRLCATALQHTADARQAFASSGLLLSNNPCLQLLERLDVGIKQTLKEQAKAAAFLNAYTELI